MDCGVGSITQQLIYADQIIVGQKIIPPGRKRAVVVEMQFSAPESADYFEFACESTNGWCAVRMHRSEQAVLVGHV
jgi:hypothetical protein